jgi:hypothetical protein
VEADGQVGAGAVEVVALVEERRQVLGPVEVAEGLDEGRPADGHDGGGVLGLGATDVEFRHSLRLQNG